MIRSFIQRLGQRNPACVFEQLDPRCKLIILIGVTLMIIFGDTVVSAGLFIGAGILACFSKLKGLFLLTSVSASVLWAVFLLIFQHALDNPMEDPGAMFVGMVFRGTVLAITGLWFAVTTKLRDMTIALETWGVPTIVVLPLTIAVRFIPTLLNESLIIHDSMRLRRLACRKRDLFTRPHLIGQSYLSLVMIRSLRMADELAAVAETRGLACPNKKQFVKPAKFRANDYYAIAILLAGMTVLITIPLFMP
jgi:energy-coupling factor transport system permease protein